MHLHDRLAQIGLLAAVVVFMGPALAGDRVLMTFDVGRWEPWASTVGPDLEHPSFNADSARFVLPRATLLRRALAGGELPLWDPSSFLGNPFLALWQTHVFYPPAWLLLAADARHAMGLTVALHLSIAALGVFALLRSLGLVVGAGLVGALAFSFGGGMALRMGHPSFIATLAWLPWATLAVERFLATRRSRWLVGLAVFFALLILAGQATLVVLSGYLLGVWCMIASARLREVRLATMALLFAALLAGTLLAAPQLLPSVELSARSARAERGVEALRRTTLAPDRAVQIVAPELYGAVRHPPAARLLPPEPERSTSMSFAAAVGGFAGAWIPAFALLAVLAGGAGGRFLGLGALVVVGLALAMGTPLFSFAHAYLPGFRFSTINRALPFVGFGLALLAARGLHVAGQGQVGRRRVWSVAGIWSLAAAGLWAWLRFASLPALAGGASEPLAHALDAADRFLVFAALGALFMALAPIASQRLGLRRVWWAAVVLLLAVELFGFAWPYRVFRPRDRVAPETPALAWLQEHGGGGRIVRFLPRRFDEAKFVQANTLALFGLREVGGFAPLHPAGLNRFLAEAGWQRHSAWSVGALSDPAALGSPLFRLLATPWILSPRGVELPGFEKVFEDDLAIWKAPTALPEAFVVREALSVRDPGEALRALSRPNFDPLRSATVETAEVPPAAPPEQGMSQASLRERSFNRIVIEVDGAAPGWLVLSEAWAPGWRVRSDGGAATEVTATNGIFLGSAVAAGQHELVFEYRPTSLRWGFTLALVGAAILAALARFARAPRG